MLCGNVTVDGMKSCRVFIDISEYFAVICQELCYDFNNGSRSHGYEYDDQSNLLSAFYLHRIACSQLLLLLLLLFFSTVFAS